jgi:hypothetical protein
MQPPAAPVLRPWQKRKAPAAQPGEEPSGHTGKEPATTVSATGMNLRSDYRFIATPWLEK